MSNLKDIERDIKKNLADSYSSFIQSDAWRDLETYANNEKEASIIRVDSKAASTLTLGEICEERGIRKGITKILLHVQNRLNGI